MFTGRRNLLWIVEKFVGNVTSWWVCYEESVTIRRRRRESRSISSWKWVGMTEKTQILSFSKSSWNESNSNHERERSCNETTGWNLTSSISESQEEKEARKVADAGKPCEKSFIYRASHIRIARAIPSIPHVAITCNYMKIAIIFKI